MSGRYTISCRYQNRFVYSEDSVVRDIKAIHNDSLKFLAAKNNKERTAAFTKANQDVINLRSFYRLFVSPS